VTHVPLIEPLVPSWKSAADPENLYNGPLDLAPNARRHDASLAWLSWVGARAALQMRLALDPAATERRCLSLAHRFREQAAEHHLRPCGEKFRVTLSGWQSTIPARFSFGWPPAR
jgi:hypothetical protein